MSVCHEIHCDLNLDGCHSHQGNSPAAWSKAYAFTKGRENGWKIKRDGSAKCPSCAKLSATSGEGERE